MQQLIESGKVARGWLGVYIGALDEAMADALGLDEPTGALVNQVTEDSPADDAGIRDGDVILEVEGKKIEDSSELVNTIANYAPGTNVELTIWRNNNERQMTVELGERPAEGDQVVEEPEKVENMFGIQVDNLTNENMRRFEVDYDEEGVLVVNVERNSAAARKGVRPGDLLMSVDRKSVTNVREFNEAMKDIETGEPVLFRLKRGNSSFFIALVPEQE
jgi:serine protease Do